MLKIDTITYSIGGQLLFDGASAIIPAGHKVGLVGRNGTGKTTLFGLITGKAALDGGAVSVSRNARIGGVAQEAPATQDSLLDTVLAADVERADLLAESETATDPHRIGDIQARLQDISAWSAEARAAAILSGLGFDEVAQARACADFSGGWRMRVALAGVLFAKPDVLLLDEPTNYLDLEGTIWLETYLAKYPHTVLVISHDRELLNNSVQAILHLENRKLTLWTGGYDQFDRQRREQSAQAEAAKRRQDARRDHMQKYVDRFRYQASKAKQAQSRLKMIERMTPISLDSENRTVSFSFPEPEELSPPILKLEGASVGYDGVPVLSHLDLRIDQDDRIALLGANGQGKSTLSKLLSGRLDVISGHMTTARKLRVGYFAQHQVDELYLDETPIEHVRRERPGETPARLRSRLASFGLGPEQAEMDVGRLSGGQKSRLALMLATLDAPHLLVLDEPTNHLDIESREALVSALNDYTGAIILVSHDPHLVSLTADRLWLVDGGKVQIFTEDLDAYRRKLLRDRSASGSRTKSTKSKAGKPKIGTAEPNKKLRMAPLRADAAKCEERVGKLQAMREKMDARLADPTLYAGGGAMKLTALQNKHHEILEALSRAEDLWLAAVEKLDRARAY